MGRLKRFAGERDRRCWTALHYAALFGKADSVRALIRAGANPHPDNSLGQTPLDLAALYDTADPTDAAVWLEIRLVPHCCPRGWNVRGRELRSWMEWNGG